MKNKTTTNAYFAAVLYAFIIGLSFLFTKMALTVDDPLNILAHRFTISFFTLLIPVLFGWINLKITARDVLSILPLSLFYPALFFAFQAFGLVYVSSSEAGIIQATIPIFTMILAALFLKENINLLQKVSLGASVCGVIYIFAMKGIQLKSASFLGIVLIMLSALSAACYNVMAKKITQKYKVIEITYIMTAIGFLSFNVLSVADHIIKNTLITYFKPFSSPVFLISIFYLGILSSLITSLLSNYILSKIDASKMSVFSNLSTLITIFAGSIFLHEGIESYHMIGAIMILFGIIGMNLLGRKRNINH
ncbi:DMT family transporter [Clostridium sp. E02]|uniref:DMT family transporter n=1 Tax=Clostridium sp. E02 TaxID=2487134 RepID=UPI000F51CE31|nr:DMT family transporter [Clostridium sp. E02]